jgi:Spy/CpxP family protein refolding chaperone
MGPGARGPEVMRELAMLGVRFYPPQLLIRRAKDVGLTPEQVNKVRDEMLATRKRAIDLHAKAEHAKLEAARLLAADKVDERAVGAQIDEAAKAHAELHKVHVASMVRVRAMLTPEQRQKLDEKKPRPPGGPRPGMGPVGQADDDADDDDADDDDDDDDGDAAG